MNPGKFPNLSHITKIALLSTSPIKASAVLDATGINPDCIDASSTGNPQPIGRFDTVDCINKRISIASEVIGSLGPDVLTIIVENALFKHSTGYSDYAKVVLILGNGTVRVESSSRQTIRVPPQYAEKIEFFLRASENNTCQVTVGELVAKELGIDCSKDWFQAVDSSNVDRRTQIFIELDEALSELDRRLGARNAIRVYPDFPEPGVEFADMFSLNEDNSMMPIEMLQNVVDELATFEPDKYENGDTSIVCGLDSRGMMLGYALAGELCLPFVPIRKAGTLPGEVLSVDYKKEYGTGTFILNPDHIRGDPNEKYALIVDDLIATGGSIVATIQLLKKAGVTRFAVVALTDVAKLRPMWRAAIETEAPGTPVRLAFV